MKSLPPRIFRFRFSLGSCLVLVTLLAVSIGLWSASARKQRIAVAELVDVGATVRYESKLEQSNVPTWLSDWLGIDYFTAVDYVQLHPRHIGRQRIPIGSEHVQRSVSAIGQLPKVAEIYFAHTGITDGELKLLEPLADQIESLHFNEPWNRELTGRGLEHLEQWTELESVFLYSGQLEVDELKHLQNLPSLERLSISGTLDEQSFSDLAKIPRLKSLALFHCWFDGRWLEKLRDAENLETILLNNCERNFTYMGPLNERMEVFEPLKPENISFMFHPGSGLSLAPILSAQPDNPKKELDDAFIRWLEDNLPKVDLMEMFQS